MITLQGKYSVANIHADGGEETAISQIIQMANSPTMKNIEIMPDFHAGNGAVVGTTALASDIICPNVVGVDIGCGMQTFHTTKIPYSLQEINARIRSVIPMGFAIHNEPKVHTTEMDNVANMVGMDKGRLMNSIGTLGGGNHFIEVGVDKVGNDWITIHSGSRNFGLQVASYYQKRAIEYSAGKADVMKGMEYLPTEEYLEGASIAQLYANLNRITMMNLIASILHVEILHGMSCSHNYVNLDDMIIRKGAVSAHKDEIIILPFNRRDGIWIMKGKGNSAWNYSAPHGAGRTMSRSQAKKLISQEQEDANMELSGVYSSYNPVDESPDAYKSPQDVTKYLHETAELLFKITPVINIKG